MSFLSQLRRRPERVRRRLVLLISVCATAVIALLWLASFSARLAEKTVENENGAVRSGPFAELGAAISLFMKESGEALRELGSLLQSGKD
jgi:hypothetical protein